MGRKGSRLTEQRLVPFEAARHVAYPYDRPRALHRVPLCGRGNTARLRSAFNESVRKPAECETIKIRLTIGQSRLLHHVSCFLIVSQPNKLRMPQMVRVCPFQELNLCN